MFGDNRIVKQNLNNGQSLRLVRGNPFYTIQGEGPYAGQPAVFIRLHGCPLRCTFCDTDFDNDDDPTMTLHEIVSRVLKIQGRATLLVITGGEPTNQNIIYLCRRLRQLEFKVQIETAGMAWIENLEHYAEIVCSPKTKTIHPKVYKYAKAFKYVISSEMQFEHFIPITATQPGAKPARLAEPRPDALIYLSPMDQYNEAKNAANRKLVGELAMRYGCFAGLQLHKYMELP